jgi:hypothetical protein
MSLLFLVSYFSFVFIPAKLLALLQSDYLLIEVGNQLAVMG